MKHLTNRYVYIYLNRDKKQQEANLSIWQSPDINAPTLGLPVPYHYRLTRNDVCYTIKSEVELSQEKAVEIAKELYNCEFRLNQQTVNIRR